VRAKYACLTRPVIPRARAEAIMKLVDGLDRVRDIGRLGSLLRRPTGSAGRSR